MGNRTQGTDRGSDKMFEAGSKGTSMKTVAKVAGGKVDSGSKK